MILVRLRKCYEFCEYLAMKAKMLSFIEELGINVKSNWAGARCLLDSSTVRCRWLDKLIIVRVEGCCNVKALCGISVRNFKFKVYEIFRNLLDDPQIFLFYSATAFSY